MLRTILTPVLVSTLAFAAVGCTKTKQEARKEGAAEVHEAQKDVVDEKKDVIDAQKDVQKAEQDVEKAKFDAAKKVDEAKP
ncbi:MAG: hypothetical protein H7249_00360 [Chitinophagaceae bacterium]|nr:hypothetical protein [Oligoflexus sp.]